MFKLLLLGVLALLSTVNGDVKHVLDGSAGPPPCYHDQDHQYHQPPAAPPANAVVPGSVAFWWADSNSPFKQSYEYFKKCSSKGDCIPPVAPSFQVPPVAPSFQVPPVAPSHQVPPAPNANEIESGKPDFERNPFLNGQVRDTSYTTARVDLSKNPFLNTGMQAAYASTGHAVTVGSEGFLGVQPAQPFGSSYPNGNQQQPSFASQHPFEAGQPFPSASPSCAGGERVCVIPQLCINGIVNQESNAQKLSGEKCEYGKQECCRFATGSASYSGSSSFESSFSASSSYSNLSHIANDKTSSSDSIIKFNGGAGLSPGSIQIVSDDQPIPNPLLVPGVKGGSKPVNKIKVIRNTYPKSVFESTIDYTNDKLDDLSYDAAFQGPQYLPPLDGTPPPVSYTPDFIPPSIPSTPRPPSIPTHYQPSTSKPQFTYPIASQPPVSYTPEFIPPSVPSSPRPPSTPTHYQPSTSRPQFTYPIASEPSYISPVVTHKPTASNEYLPPYPTNKPSRPPPNTVHISTDTKVNTQYANTPPHVIYTRPTIATSPRPIPTNPTPGYQYTNPTPGYQYTNPTSGYQHTSPTPGYQHSSPTPGYQYPQPSPPFTYPKPSTKQPTKTGSSSNVNNQFISRPTNGYSYPTPTPTFGYPSPTPKPTPYKPTKTQPPQNGYSYPTPHPPFTYSPESSNVGNVYHPRPSQTTLNQYLPPRQTTEPNLETGASGTGEVIRPPPNKNNHHPSPNEPIGSVVSPHGGCAAALKCVQEIYCTAEGMISPTPVVLTKAQEFLRVPTTDCFDRQAGIVGKCCRDPFYVDPWPSANLVNGFDDGQYKEDPRLGQYFAPKPRAERSSATKNDKCGIRNPNIAPRGESPLDVNFAEIPWQAMVLRDTNRSLLCGGAIIKPNAVLTAAHCVEGLDTRDILVKGGEWKLGIDEEPLPFQIVKVAAVIRHPAYTPGSLQNDLALLMLDERLRTAKNIAPLCLPSPKQAPSGHCIATGWGKKILQLHLRGAIMRSIDVNLMDPNTCTQRLQSKYPGVLPDFSETVICADSNRDHCEVDYGSALACTNGDGQYTLAGIFSWETGCKDQNQIGGYIPPDMQWIETTLAKPLRELKALDRQYHQ